METVSTPGEVGSRKPHRKSRNGCLRCKKRKIKCDEQRPSCSNCLKHSVQCDFLLPPPRSSLLANETQKPIIHQPRISPHENPQSFHSTPNSAAESPYNAQQAPSLNLLDLELLHNFCTSTCNTFHSDSSLKTVWRINVPQLAFTNSFVMHGVLAMSALHLAYCKPSKRDFYLSQSAIHHQTGLRQVSNILPHVTESNCTALYIFSAITCIFTLASPRKPDDFLVVGESGIAEWLQLFRGTRSIIEFSGDTLRNGTLGPMFVIGTRKFFIRQQLAELPFPAGEQLAELEIQIRRTANGDVRHLQIYADAIYELQKSFAVVYQEGARCESEDVFIWLFRVSDEYLMLLRERTQEALSIFAFFCVIPKRLEANWWIEGWSGHLMTRIYLLLDEEHRLWVRWAMNEIGWVPN